MINKIDDFMSRYSRWPSIKAFSDEVNKDWVTKACKQGYKPYKTLKAPSDYGKMTAYDSRWVLVGPVKS